MYWITRLDGLHVFFITMLTLLVVVLVIVITCFFAGMYEDEEHGVIKRVKMWTKIMSISLVVFALGAIFVPTTSDALLIYGVGGTIDYIKSNKTAQKLPDKCIKALDKYLDEQNSKTNEPGK